MNMPAPLTIAARRAMVEELVRQEPGISARNIAARLGVGKDTIRRDLAEISQAKSQPAPEAAASEPEPAPHAPPDDDRLTVPYDDQLRAGLATLAEAGHTRDDAVRLAVTVLARAYEGAWKFGLYPRGVAPRVRVVDLYPYKQEGRRS